MRIYQHNCFCMLYFFWLIFHFTHAQLFANKFGSLTVLVQFFMWRSGAVGVAGTQCRTRANERPQQAAYSSSEILFCRPNEHEDKRHTQPDIHSQRGPQRKQANGTAIRFSKQPSQQNLCFVDPLQLQISLELHNQLNQIRYQIKA